MNLFLPDGTLIRGLKTDNIVVQAKEHKVAVSGLDLEGGTRRVLIVLDTGGELSSDAHKAAALALEDLAKNAPPGDSLALNTARGPLQQVKFGEPRSALASALDELSAGGKMRQRHDGVLDALHEGIAWFRSAHPGDSIVVIADGIENDNHVSFGTVAEELRNTGIRLFSIQLGPIMAGEYWTTAGIGPQGQPSFSTATFINHENISALSWNSGGYMALHSMVGAWKSYHLTADDLKVLDSQLYRIYDAILGDYVLHLTTDELKKPTEWTVRFADPLEKSVPQARFAYPRLLMPCGK